MSAQTLFFLLLLLACPLMMLFMHRGGHGAHGAEGGHSGHMHGGADPPAGKAADGEPPSLEELREQLSELDAQIRALEERDSDRLTAAR